MLNFVPDMQLRLKDNALQCLRGGTLMDIYHESLKDQRSRILNALDLPMGGNDITNTVQYS
jgi:hypothetical protein